MPIVYSESTGKFYDTDTGQVVEGMGTSTPAPAPPDVSFGEGLQQGLGRLWGDIGQNTGIRGPYTPEEETAWQNAKRGAPAGSYLGHQGPQFAPFTRGGVIANAVLGAVQNFVAGDPEQSPGQRAVSGAGWSGGGAAAGKAVDWLSSLKGIRHDPGMGGQTRVTRSGGRMGRDEYEAAMTARAGQAGAPDLASESRRLLDRGDALGMASTAGVERGDEALKIMEAASRGNPLSGVKGAKLRAMQDSNRKALNKAYADKLEVPDLSGANLANARKQIQAKYSALEAQIDQIVFDDTMLDDLAEWEIRAKDAASFLPTKDARRALDKVLDRVGERDQLTGKQFGQLRNDINKAVRDSYKQGKATYAESLEELLDILQTGAEDQIGAELAPAYREVGDQWRVFRSLRDGKALDRQSGNINPTSLDSNLRRRDIRGYDEGLRTDDHYDALRYSLMNKDVIGNSGTAARTQSNTGNTILDQVLNVTQEPAGRGLFTLEQMSGPQTPVWSTTGGILGRGLLMD